MFGRVSVWLDERAPARGALAYAQEWADRLRRPLRLFNPAGQPAESAPARPPQDRGGTALAAPAAVTVAAEADPECGDLCVFGRSLPKDLRTSLLDRSLRQGAALLVCPDEWHPLSRALVLHEDDGDESFLRTAARLCGSLQSRAVVLTVAHSDRDAAQRGQRAQEVLADAGPVCGFDELTGLDASSAVLHVASWRHCQVVLLRRRSGRRWWPWSGDTLERLTAHPSPLAFLALPATSAADD